MEYKRGEQVMPKRRKYDAAFKFKVVMEILTGDLSVMEASRHDRIKDSLLYAWKAQFLERGPQLFVAKDAECKRSQDKLAALERKVGQLTMDNDILKKASSSLTRLPAGNGSRRN